eukprot:gene28852-34822_t
MHLKRLQFAINHHDPAVISIGLKEFLQELLKYDQVVADLFQCRELPTSPNGLLVFNSIRHDSLPDDHILVQLLASSPSLEDFFSLWTFTALELDVPLAKLTFDVLTAIVEILPSDSPTLPAVINKLYKVHVEYVQRMLDKNDVKLLNSMFRLFAVTCKKAQIPIELAHMLLSGNLFKKMSKLAVADGEEDKFYYLVKLLVTLVVHADLDLAKRLLDSPNMDSVQSLVNEFSDETYSVYLVGLLYLFIYGARLAEEISQKFYSLASTKSLLAAASSSTSKYDLCISYLEAIVLSCKSENKQESGLNRYHRRNYAKILVTSLDPLLHPAHVKIQVLLLKDFPDLAKKCLFPLQEQLKSSVYDEPYLNALKHLVNVIECVSDHALKSSMDGMVSFEREAQLLEVLKLITVDLLPAGLSKADLRNILTKASTPFQLEVFLLIGTLLRNVKALFQSHSFEKNMLHSALQSLFTSYFPDVRDLIVARSTAITGVIELHNADKKISRSEAVVQSAPQDAKVPKNVEEDMELNWEVDDDDKAEPSKEPMKIEESESAIQPEESGVPIEERCLVALFECWELYLQLHPACKTTVANDATKLLEDMAALKEREHLYKHVIGSLELGRRHFSWFGTDEENLKMFHNLFMLPDYRAALKNFVLSSLYEHVQGTSLAKDCSSLIHSVLYVNSGLFEAHRIFSYEMNTEVASFIEAVKLLGVESMAILESIVRISYTWNVQLADDCAKAAQSDNLAPISPVLYCMLCLLAGRFVSFLPLLSSKQRMVLVAFMADVSPEEYDMDACDNTSIGTAVRTPEQRAQFFTKFETGFAAKLREVVVQTLVRQVHAVRDSIAYSRLLYKVVVEMKHNFESFIEINDLVRSLYYTFTPSANPNPPQKVSSIWRHLEDSVDNKCTFIGKVCMHIDIILQGRDKKIIKKLLKHNGAEAIESLDSTLSQALDSFWMQVGTVYLEKLCIAGSMPEGLVLSWLHSKWIGNCAETTTVAAVLRVSCMLKQLFSLDELIRSNLPRPSEMNQTPDLQQVVPVEIFSLSDYLCTLLISILTAIQHAPDGKLITANLVEGSLLRHHLMDSTAFGMLCRKAFEIISPQLREPSTSMDALCESIISKWDVKAAAADVSYKTMLNAMLTGDWTVERRLAMETLLHEMKLADPISALQDLLVASDSSAHLPSFRLDQLQFATSINNASPLVSCYLTNSSVSANPLSFLTAMAHLDHISDRVKFISNAGVFSDQMLWVLNSSSLPKATKLLSANVQLNDSQKGALPSELQALEACLETPFVSFEVSETPKNVKVGDCVSLAQQLLECVRSSFDGCFTDLLIEIIAVVRLLNENVQFSISCILVQSLCRDGKQLLLSELCLDMFLFLVQRSSKVRSLAITRALSKLYVKLIFWCTDVSIKSAKRIPESNYLSDARRVVSCLARCATELNDGDIEAIKAQLIKWLRALLKNRYEDDRVYPVVISFYSALYAHQHVFSDDSSWYCPRLAIKHVSEHTKFSLIFESSDMAHALAKAAILKLILVLVRICLCRGYTMEVDIQALLMPTYSPNLLPENRIILRIVQLVNWHSDPEADNVRVLVLSRAQQTLQSYLFDIVKPTKVYHTIGTFPVRRQLVNNVFSWESSDFDIHHIETLIQAYYSQIAEGYLQAAIDYDIAADRQEMQDCYDPAYYMPIILHSLETENILVKNWLQSGLCSLIFVSLASDCAAMRTLALASLQLLYMELTSEKAERDVAFRERQHVLQLFDFVRNAIFDEGIDLRQTQLPLASAAFLARSAMVLMQPTHSFYMPTCRYLINRKFLDCRDLPLVETSLAESRDLGVWTQVVRNIRDCLRTGADHRNFCRKHVYTHISLLISSVGDAKLTMAYLDIVERALCLPDAAAYLLEKTPLLLSLYSLLSPQTNVTLYSRGICLVHKAVRAAHLLTASSNSKNSFNSQLPHVREAVLYLLASVQQRLCSAASSSSISEEVLAQVVSLLWDYEVLHAGMGLQSLGTVHAATVIAMLRHSLAQKKSHESIWAQALLSLCYSSAGDLAALLRSDGVHLQKVLFEHFFGEDDGTAAGAGPSAKLLPRPFFVFSLLSSSSSPLTRASGGDVDEGAAWAHMPEVGVSGDKGRASGIPAVLSSSLPLRVYLAASLVEKLVRNVGAGVDNAAGWADFLLALFHLLGCWAGPPTPASALQMLGVQGLGDEGLVKEAVVAMARGVATVRGDTMYAMGDGLEGSMRYLHLCARGGMVGTLETSGGLTDGNTADIDSSDANYSGKNIHDVFGDKRAWTELIEHGRGTKKRRRMHLKAGLGVGWVGKRAKKLRK